jgi:hypothetical protein
MHKQHSWMTIVSVALGAPLGLLAIMATLSPTEIFSSFAGLIPVCCLALCFMWAVITFVYFTINMNRQAFKPFGIIAAFLVGPLILTLIAPPLKISFRWNKRQYEAVVKLAYDGQLEPANGAFPESNYFLSPQYAFLSFDGGVRVTGKEVMFHNACDPLTADFCTGIAYQPAKPDDVHSVLASRCPGTAQWRRIPGEDHWYECN